MRTIGRYAILGLLGRGGMGVVYKAAMPRTGRVVAVKVLKPSEMLAATADPALLRRDFFREAALMAGIRHPNIAQVLDVDEAPAPDGGSGGSTGGRPFFVMEYYCNNLGALLGEGYRVEEPTRRLGVDQALSCARQLASACARLHHAGILHRDVKPYNLMLAERPPDTCLTGSGQADVLFADEVKLIDFGLSRLRGEKGPARPRGAVVGSPYYAAPEQEADPESADERADVFSAAVTLFRCLTGRLPQEGLPASSLRVGLDQRFDAFFARACHEDRRQRPGTCWPSSTRWQATGRACATRSAPCLRTARRPAPACRLLRRCAPLPCCDLARCASPLRGRARRSVWTNSGGPRPATRSALSSSDKGVLWRLARRTLWRRARRAWPGLERISCATGAAGWSGSAAAAPTQ